MTTLDTLLYWYTLTFSVALIVSAVSSGFSLTHLTTLAFFLPVPVFLLLQTLKRYYLWRQLQLSHPPTHTTTMPAFNLKQFLTQTNPAYIFTLILFITAMLISLIKTLSLR